MMPNETQAIGLDIGGANIKAATCDGVSISQGIEIWNHCDGLREVLNQMLDKLPKTKLLAVTMTAELADCFKTKSEGVHSIVNSVEQIAADRDVFIWQTGAEFVRPEIARDIPLMVAAANWHGLATFAGRLMSPGAGLLIDIGTTTTDIIPLLDGVPIPQGFTDVERLQSGELVYSGSRRTPLCAVAHSVPFRDGYCPLAAELFATMLDVYLILDRIDEDESCLETANGRPATQLEARHRLARAICGDVNEISDDDLQTIVRFLADVQAKRIAGPLQSVVSRLPQQCESVIISGSGTFLAEQLITDNAKTKAAAQIRLLDCLTPEISEAACAFAIAKLAVERL